ncbi:MAG: transglycosylase SLT domain-containing protein [bacterium]
MDLTVEIARSAPPETGAKGEPARNDAIQTQKAWRACQEFESILLYHILSTMRKAWANEEDQDQYGFGNEIFKSMMDEQLSIAMARSGGIGIARMISQQLGIDPPERKIVSPPREFPKREERIERTKSKQTDIMKKSEDVLPRTQVNDSSPIKRRFEVFEERIKPFEGIIRKAAETFGIGFDLIKAVIIQESGGDPNAISPKGAKGLMQLMDATAETLGITNPFDPVQNIFGGARLLARLLERFNGDLKLALASYNAGIGAVEKHKGIPPYKETRDYVERVAKYLEGLRRNG